MSPLVPPTRGINPHPYRAWIDGSLRFGSIVHDRITYIPLTYAIILINDVTWTRHNIDSFYVTLRNLGLGYDAQMKIIGLTTYIPVGVVMKLIEEHPNMIMHYAPELTEPNDSIC